MQREWKKTLTFLVAITILGGVIATALIINQATKITEDHLWDSVPAMAGIEVSQAFPFDENDKLVPGYEDWRDLLRTEWPLEYLYLSEAHFQLISDLDYVKQVEQHEVSFLFSHDLERVGLGTDATQSNSGERANQFSAIGVANPDFFLLTGGAINITQGRSFTEDEFSLDSNQIIPVLVSEEFADLNYLDSGSIFSLDHTYYYHTFEDWGNREILEQGSNVIIRHQYQFQVVGIFQSNLNPNDIHMGMTIAERLLNTIVMPRPLLEALNQQLDAEVIDFHMETYGYVKSSRPTLIDIPEGMMQTNFLLFILNDAKDLPAFQAAATEILPPAWQVRIGVTFDDLLDSLTIIQEITQKVFWAGAVATVVILTLLTIGFMKNQSSGKKNKPCYQFLLESLIIAVFSLSISLGSGIFIASNISQGLLEQELNRQTEANPINGMPWHINVFSTPMGWVHPSQMTQEEKIDRFDIVIEKPMIFNFYAIGITAITLSTIIGTLYVVKSEPNQKPK